MNLTLLKLALSFVGSYWREAAIGALAVTLVASCHARDVALQQRGRAEERARVADSTLKAVKPQLARAETTLVHDTVRVRVAVDRVITQTDTVLAHLTDTILVKSYVQTADSAAKACSLLVTDCARYRDYAEQTIRALEAKVAAANAMPKKSCTLPTVGGMLLGAGVGFVLNR